MSFPRFERVRPGQAFENAIRSIALEELAGEDTARRTSWLSDRTGVSIETIQLQVTEMVDLLAN